MRLVTYLFFGISLLSYSSSSSCKKNLKSLRQKKKLQGKKLFVATTRGHKLVSSRSRTRGIFVVSAFLRRVLVP